MKKVLRTFRSVRPAWFRYLLAILLVGAALLLLFVGSVYAGMWGRLPGKSELREIRHDRASEVYASDSTLIGKYYLADRQPIDVDVIPQHVLEALVAIEDERFYRHSGIDYPSLVRVFFKTLLMGDRSAGGGSTLSQQLAKNLYPRSARGGPGLAVDKLKEMFTARRLEAIYSKKEILGLYLNTVSFGDNSFGIESAAQKFFGVPAKELRTEEAATLIGMLKATYSYNPRLFPDRSLERRNLVLEAMARNEYLEGDKADSLQALPLELDYNPYSANEGMAAYFRETVRREVADWLKSRPGTDSALNLYTSGLRIYTTLNPEMQRLAEAAMREHMQGLQADFEKAYGKSAPWEGNRKFIDRYIRQSPPYRKLASAGLDHQAILDSLGRKRPMVLADWDGETETEASTLDSLMHYARFLNTGSLAIDSRSGAVLSWIGGINFKYFKYDHISQSRRQVGSTFKPIVYTAALESGIDPCQHFSAREVRYENLEDWTPSNSGDEDEAYLNYSMEAALQNSVNTVAVKVLEQTGIPEVVARARAMGIEAPLPEKPSLALGTGSIGIPELAGAYASFVNRSRPVAPYLIERITDRQGQELYRHEPEEFPPAYSERTRQLMLEMLQAVVDGGTASRIRGTYGLRGDIAGKTGTTQNNKDAWFAAITPRLVHVSWVGLESHEIGFPNTQIGQGANAALPLFARWYGKLASDPALRGWTTQRFGEPSGEVADLLDCEPVKRDGFFKRLFTNPDKAKTRKFKDKSGN